MEKFDENFEMSESMEGNRKEEVDSSFSSDLQRRYEEYMNYGSKQDLMELKTELLDMKDVESGDDDPPEEKVLKLTLHR